jgi:hypothetical protein
LLGLCRYGFLEFLKDNPREMVKSADLNQPKKTLKIGAINSRIMGWNSDIDGIWIQEILVFMDVHT